MNTPSDKAKLPKTTRLANLLLFLKGSKGGVTAREIRDNVAGYDGNQADAAFNRQFRRDRADLSGMGFPIVQSMGDDGMPRYELDVSQTRQQSLDLGPKDVALLEICAKNALENPGFPLRAGLASALHKLPHAPTGIGHGVGVGAEMAGTAGRRGGKASCGAATTGEAGAGAAASGEAGAGEAGTVAEVTGEVAAGAGAVDDAEVTGKAGGGTATETAIAKAVERARQEGRALAFGYETASGETSERVAVPVAVFSYLGALYLFAYDCNRAGMRRFRFGRMLGTPSLTAAPEGALDAARAHARDDLVALPFQIGDGRLAGRAFFSSRIAGSAAGLTQGKGALTPCGDGLVWEIEVASADAFVRWAIENGPGILVLDPPEAADMEERLAAYIAHLEEQNAHAENSRARTGGDDAPIQ